jgi:hypothetical protein
MGKFSGLTMIPGVGHEYRQDVLRKSDEVHPLVEFLQNRKALPGRCGCAVFVGGRALSSHGFCAVDLARVSARYWGEPGSESEHALWLGVSLLDQEKHVGRCQREKGLENLGRSCCSLDSKSPQNLYRRRLRVGSEERGLCPGLQHHRHVYEPFYLGLTSFDQVCGEGPYLFGPPGCNASFTYLSDRNTPDTRVLDMLVFEPGAFHVMDLSYVDFMRLYRLH